MTVHSAQCSNCHRVVLQNIHRVLFHLVEVYWFRYFLLFRIIVSNYPNASFQTALLPIQLENRNSRVSGFRDQDVLTLQKILDEEFELEKESIIKHQREKREQAAKQAGLQRKRMMLERQLREEISEIEKDHRIDFWLALVSLSFHKPHVCTTKKNTEAAQGPIIFSGFNYLVWPENGCFSQAHPKSVGYMVFLCRYNQANPRAT